LTVRRSMLSSVARNECYDHFGAFLQYLRRALLPEGVVVSTYCGAGAVSVSLL
jgi:hypothetical protein